eukprot:7973461-Alexandrium_andersonii.AAC.1
MLPPALRVEVGPVRQVERDSVAVGLKMQHTLLHITTRAILAKNCVSSSSQGCSLPRTFSALDL